MSDQALFFTRQTASNKAVPQKASQSTQHIIAVARELGIEVEELPGTKIFKAKYKNQEQLFFYQVPPQTTALGLYATDDKNVTNMLLRRAQIQVPKGYFISKLDPLEYYQDVFDALQKPLVVKPNLGTHGSLVHVGITDKNQFIEIVKNVLTFSRDSFAGAIVEEMFAGQEYRILFGDNRVIGVINRVPANIIGNGQNTINELIHLKNQHPVRVGSGKFIKEDDEMHEMLDQHHYTLDSILPTGEQLFFKKVSNFSQGGDIIDATDLIHPSVAEIAKKVVEALPGIAWAGIDFMTKDITQAQTPETYSILEVNWSPGLDLHDMPMEGINRQAARAFIKQLFPNASF